MEFLSKLLWLVQCKFPRLQYVQNILEQSAKVHTKMPLRCKVHDENLYRMEIVHFRVNTPTFLAVQCLCGFRRQQMVQVHRINVPNLPLIYIEDRQPYRILDDALVKKSSSSIYVKWETRLLWKKTKSQRNLKSAFDMR